MIIPEKDKTNVIFSSLFISHYPELYKQLSDIMWNYHKGYGAVCHTKDYWVRDFMPVQVDEDVFVRFIFKSSKNKKRNPSRSNSVLVSIRNN